MTVGTPVLLPDGRKGMIVGWHGPSAVVSLDVGGFVEVLERDLRRVR